MTIKNECNLIGILKEPAVEGRAKFYYLEIPRLSGKIDRIRVKFNNYFNGEMFLDKKVKLKDAHLRTYTDKHSKKLYIYVTTTDIEETEEKYNNQIAIDVAIVKVPVYRETPLGRKILDLLIVNNFERSNYIPALMWDKYADQYKDLKVSDELKLVGMLQSREYTNRKQETHTAYEFSISNVITKEDKLNEGEKNSF